MSFSVEETRMASIEADESAFRPHGAHATRVGNGQPWVKGLEMPRRALGYS